MEKEEVSVHDNPDGNGDDWGPDQSSSEDIKDINENISLEDLH
jgi:hypothetical protein